MSGAFFGCHGYFGLGAVLALLLGLWSPEAALAAEPEAQGTMPVLVPDQFLRRWDPVTLFFAEDSGPKGGGPEDRPGDWVELSPPHPGAYTWLDARTLQFRPVEPWPPLARFEWRLGSRSQTLATLMSAPSETRPAQGAEGLDPVDAISLTFAEPVDAAALANMVRIELRPLPGVDSRGATWMDADDFDIKVVERHRRDDPATYVLTLRRPIPIGKRALLRLTLSADESVDDAFWTLAFTTAEPFRVLHFGCADRRYPVVPEGVSYARDEAVRCDNSEQKLAVEFSAPPADLGPIEARNLVRISPPVEGVAFDTVERTLLVSGHFKQDTLYEMRLEPGPLSDDQGRPLEMPAASRLYFHFPPRPRYLKWTASHGIVERFGPQMLPLEGRGHERVDLRIHAVDPLDRSFWPFPQEPVSVDERARPPGPGEEPVAFTDPERHITPQALGGMIKALGSPTVSSLVDLPLRRRGGSAAFGLDLKPHLEPIAGAGAPGTYLVGVRNLDESGARHWSRLQVTDLSLTTVEEEDAVRFAVTSLASGAPVHGAHVRVEGTIYRSGARWDKLASGRTDAAGMYLWQVKSRKARQRVRRIVVTHREDTLVLEPRRGPERYRTNHWTKSPETWLQWTQHGPASRREQAETLCHVFTERPVYRPDQPVHVKGYIRDRYRGGMTEVVGRGTLVVTGPGDLEWRYPVELTPQGSFYHRFAEEKLPTGAYAIHFEYPKRPACGSVTIRKEAYRLPKFEVELSAPDRTPLDAPFEVLLTGRYYAGGRVSERPLKWRVTQFPYAWTPKTREGFHYSSDARFSAQQRFESSPVTERDALTDNEGAAKLELNPATEPTAQPRRYVVEATVTGADDQTVTGTRQILALPPFVLGLKAPRYLERAEHIRPEIIAVDTEGELLAGKAITVRLLHRQWHSHLRAGNFSEGVAQYVTDVVDEKVFETTLTSATEPLEPELPISEAGVYIVELEARDRLGRAQVVRLDLFAGGDEPVTWARPPSQVFTVTPDRDGYAPGDTTKLLLESPFQTARALAVIEAPEANHYRWLDVRNGAAVLELPIERHYVPRLPVHFVLMRGRLNGVQGRPNGPDLGKPATLAATALVAVEPVEHRVEVDLSHPDRALPGDEITVGIKLRDHRGQPLAGEVTLWLVDQAVLALGEEQRLDPLPDFVTARDSRLEIRDTRNLVLGYLPLQEQPGGGAAARAEPKDLLDRVSVRKNFDPVPYFNPRIMVGANGEATLKVRLPDSLTNFKLRAKAISGPDRFGVATGTVAVRLPVIVQPALPRFVRPGDRFTASAIGRVVEGEGGPGAAEIRVDGIELTGPARREINWDRARPERIDYQVSVPTPVYDANGEPERDSVKFTIGVERNADQARDAFEVTLPVRPDRHPVVQRSIETLTSAKDLTLPAVEQAPRPGTFKRTTVISTQPALTRMAAGLSYLAEYPHGCTEQRISRARAQLAFKRFRDVLALQGEDEQLERQVNQTLEWIESAIAPNDLVAYWPGSRGYVSLTAWAVQFMIEARKAGFAVQPEEIGDLTRSLQRALRSDYRYYIDGAAYAERIWALTALADAGALDVAYAAELARRTQFLPLESIAQVLRALSADDTTASLTIQDLTQVLWDGLATRLHQGNEVYAGLQETAGPANKLILPSEARTLSEILRTVSLVGGGDPRRQLVADALVGLGRGDGWGDTNANAAALLALGDFMLSSLQTGEPREVRITVGGQPRTVTLDAEHPLHRESILDNGPLTLSLVDDQGPPLSIKSETRFVPLEDGSAAAAQNQGFVVKREWLKISDSDKPAARIALEPAGLEVDVNVGDVVEEHLEVVNPDDRHYVAVVVPLSAGMEPLNPTLATSPPEATPSRDLSREPAYVAFLDDSVTYYYDELAKGTYHFYFRTRATIPGRFTQPPAYAEMMYSQAVNGRSHGARVVITPAPVSNDRQ